MDNSPIIVISNISSGAGATTLAFNLSGALWSDGYDVKIYSPHKEQWQEFIKTRKIFSEENSSDVFMPQISSDINKFDLNAKSVIIADISADDIASQAQIFNSAHTLITVIDNDIKDFSEHQKYINAVWNAKKNIAAQGIKYLNWIIVPNQSKKNADNVVINELTAKRHGFRIAPQLPYREEYQYMTRGYCVGEMPNLGSSVKMTIGDVYARREILKLTDFLWKQK